ncbi:hypothetical protein EBR56_01735 [bacterium]|nr:hypothetical protein [bacterium]
MQPHARGTGTHRTESGEEPHRHVPRPREISGPEDGVVTRRAGTSREAAVSVTVLNRQRLVRVAAAWLERIVRRGLAAQGVGRAEVSVLIVNDRRIGRLHAEWFGDPSPTDVITFPLSEPAADLLAGDLVVSAETAQRRGREFG